MKATEVTAGLAESNGRLLPGLWRDSLHVTCGLTACTSGTAPGLTLGNEYGKTLFFTHDTGSVSSGDVVIRYVLPAIMNEFIFAHKPRLLDVAAQLKRSAHAALGLAINCAQ